MKNKKNKKMSTNTELLALCKGISRMNKKSQLNFINNMNHKTLHCISEIFYNMQYLTKLAPIKLRKRLICSMQKNSHECQYISKITGKGVIKRKYLKSQIGTGVFSLLLSSAIPILADLIAALSPKK